MLRVMMVVPQYPYPVVGGLERQAHELAKALSDLGVEVQALSGVVCQEQPSYETVEGVVVHRVQWPRQKWLRFLRTPFDLCKTLYLHRNTYDVVHLHQHSWFGLFTIISSRILGKPIITKLPNVGDLGIPGMLALPFGRTRLRILLRSDALVAMSCASIQELKDVGFPVGRILATPNGIHILPKQSLALKARGVSRVCRVVCVARLQEQKNIDDLLHAWSAVYSALGNTCVLEIWGSGQLEPELRQLAQKLGLASSVSFCGHLEGIREKLLQMDIFVLPSRVEGNSNAILEAMAAGLPIVSTRVGGTPMLVGEDGADFLFEVADRLALVGILLRLVKNEVERKALGEAMRNRIENYFDIRQVASTYVCTYQSLVAGKSNRVNECSNSVVLRY